MKLTGSLNIQNHNWNGIKNHVNRHFEDSKTGTHKDTNLAHINQSLSKINKGSDGQIKLIHGHKRFVPRTKPNKYFKSAKQLSNEFQQSLNDTYSTYIQLHNQSKSVKKHPKRKITDLYKQKLLKKANKRDKEHDPTAKTKLDTYQKTLVQNIGNTDLNQKLIHKLMKIKHWSYHQARNNFLRASSLAGVLNVEELNDRHPHIHLLHYMTNDEEVADKQKRKPDALHTHYSAIGTSFTKLDKNFKPIKPYTTTDKNGKVHHHRGSKPSFSFARALCQDEHIPYRKKTIKIKAHNKNGYRKVNASYHKALSKFRTQEGQSQISTLNIMLNTMYQVNLHLTYYQTGQKVNGLSMNAERVRQQAKHMNQLITKHHRQLGAKRSRRLHHYQAQNKKYHQHLRYLKHRQHQIKVKSSVATTKSLAVIKKSKMVNQKSNQVAYNQISYSNSANDFASGANYYFSSSYQSSAQSELEPQLQSVSSASSSISDNLASLKNLQATINSDLKNKTALDYQMRRQQLLFEQRKQEQQKHIEDQNQKILLNNELAKDQQNTIHNQQNTINDKEFQSQTLDKSINHKRSILNSLTDQFSAVKEQIKTYEDNFTNFTQNIIKSTKQALHQEATRNVNNVRQLQSANAQHIYSATQQLSNEATKSKTGLFGKIGSFAHQVHSNYQSNKASKSASKSYQHSLASTNSSIAEPVVAKSAQWNTAVDSLEQKSGEVGLFMNENDKLNSLLENKPMNVTQYSNSVKSATGMTLIQSSKSSSASLSQAMPSIKASEASQSRAWSIEDSKQSVAESIKNRQIDREFSESEKISRQVDNEQARERQNYIQNHPEQYKKWLSNHQSQGPTMS